MNERERVGSSTENKKAVAEVEIEVLALSRRWLGSSNDTAAASTCAVVEFNGCILLSFGGE